MAKPQEYVIEKSNEAVSKQDRLLTLARFIDWLTLAASLLAQLCLGLNANEIQIPYDKHHKVSSLVKSRQNTHNSVKYEVIWKCEINLSYEVISKQYLHSILDISVLAC